MGWRVLTSATPCKVAYCDIAWHVCARSQGLGPLPEWLAILKDTQLPCIVCCVLT